MQPNSPRPDRRGRRALVAVTTLLVLGSIAATAMIGYRIQLTGNTLFTPLSWNLFLAWVPFPLALLVHRAHRRGAPGALLVAGLVPWLLFLPNAPYLLTDFIHLYPRPGVPLWFDAALIGAHAGVGLLVGLVSLLLVHRVAAERWGAAIGWLVSVAALLLSTLGVYLGRVLRFNSWDVVTDPLALLGVVLQRLVDPLGNPRLNLVFGLGSVGLLGCYLVVWAIGRAVSAPQVRCTRCG